MVLKPILSTKKISSTPLPHFTSPVYINTNLTLHSPSLKSLSSSPKPPSMFGTSLLPSPPSSFHPRSRVQPLTMARAMASTTGLHPVESKPFHNTLYQVLHIKNKATQFEIKAAYRSLAKQYHPDVSSASSSDIDCSAFIHIHHAYATLSDPIARANYDKCIGATSSYSVSRIPRYRRTRTWETDQCW